MPKRDDNEAPRADNQDDRKCHPLGSGHPRDIGVRHPILKVMPMLGLTFPLTHDAVSSAINDLTICTKNVRWGKGSTELRSGNHDRL